ncbi:MAG: RNA-binding S4 domain-containing protein [Propionibacteriaceae bacterium]|nr:RNA-binding S4 domain-containing protein [Propionibacteriaceae bacterium]
MRVDTWLWAARFFKSRSMATTACKGGKVRLNGHTAKPAADVKVGDTLEWHDALRAREVEVVQLLTTRVGAPLAVLAYIDRSEPVPPRELRGALPMRDRGAGRPEKRDRRELDHLRGYAK